MPLVSVGVAMTLPNGSASSTERLIACPASVVLPRVNRTSEYAERGHGIHAYIRDVLSGVLWPDALLRVDEEHRPTCRSIDWFKLCGDITEIKSEAAYAIDVRARTARFLGCNVGRDYERAALKTGAPLGEWEIPGAIDIDGVTKGEGVPVIDDVKSGHLDVTPAAENGQLLFFASARHLIGGHPVVLGRISKVKEDGAIWNDVASFDTLAIDDYLDSLELAVERSQEQRRVYLAGGTPEVAEGAHCRYCAAANACPAKVALAKHMLSTLAPVQEGIAEMSLAEAGQAWELVHEKAAPLVELMEEALKERARREPLPLSGGRELREAPYEKESPMFAAAIELAKSLGATEAQIKNCYRPIVARPVRACKVKGAKK